MSLPPFRLPLGTTSRTIYDIMEYFNNYLEALDSDVLIEEWQTLLKDPLNAHSKKMHNLYLAIKDDLLTFPNAISDWDDLRVRHGFTNVLKSFSKGLFHRDDTNSLVLDNLSIPFKNPVTNSSSGINSENVWKMLTTATKSNGFYALLGAGVSNAPVCFVFISNEFSYFELMIREPKLTIQLYSCLLKNTIRTSFCLSIQLKEERHVLHNVTRYLELFQITSNVFTLKI
jgi:hypothetical protein